MRRLTWLDLFSGLGGASRPAKDRDWRVIRVDIEEKFKPDIVADVRTLPLTKFPVDFLWASPPCQEFSKHGLRCFYPNPPEPSLALAHAVKQIIAQFQPRFWCVENVWASRPWLTNLFGPVRAMVPGHALWSNLPLLLPSVKAHKSSSGELPVAGVGAIPRRGTKFADAPRKTYRGREERHCVGNRRTEPNARSFIANVEGGAASAAKIPYEIGDAICAAVERMAL